MSSIKSIPVTEKVNKQKVIESINNLKIRFYNPINFFIYINIIIYFLYFVKKIFF